MAIVSPWSSSRRKIMSPAHRRHKRDHGCASRLKTVAWSLFLLALCYRLGNPAPPSGVPEVATASPPLLRSASTQPAVVQYRQEGAPKPREEPVDESHQDEVSDSKPSDKSEGRIPNDDDDVPEKGKKSNSGDQKSVEEANDEPEEQKEEEKTGERESPADEKVEEEEQKPDDQKPDDADKEVKDEPAKEEEAEKKTEEGEEAQPADEQPKSEEGDQNPEDADKQQEDAKEEPGKEEDGEQKTEEGEEAQPVDDQQKAGEEEQKIDDADKQQEDAKDEPAKEEEAEKKTEEGEEAQPADEQPKSEEGDQNPDDADKPQEDATEEPGKEEEGEQKTEEGEGAQPVDDQQKAGEEEQKPDDADKQQEDAKDEPATEEGNEQKPEGEDEAQRNSNQSNDEKEDKKEGSNEEEEEEPFPNAIFVEALRPAEIADWDYFPEIEKQSVQEPVLHLDPEKCSNLPIDTSPPPRRPPSEGACDGYDGILHIQQGDFGGASGTIFFQYMVGQLQWAEQHNFKPWVHMNDFSKPIFDKVVHTQGPTINLTMMGGKEIGWGLDKNDPIGYAFPGKLVFQDDVTEMYSRTFEFEGTGIWNHYFEPVSDFSPDDPSCANKPYVAMSDYHILPGLHAHAPWAPRAWRYWCPDYIRKSNVSLTEWFEPQRKHAAAITKRYIRFNEDLEQRAACAHPNTENSLGMHIRHGDKWVSRIVIGVAEFLPFCEAFVDNGGGSIFLATDSALVYAEIMRDWPERVTSHIVRQQSVKALSRNGTASFGIGVSTHRSNVEALTDMLALSKCTYLLHGLSALTEAAFYMNPGLLERSVNLEEEPEGSAYIDKEYEERRRSVSYFVDEILRRGRTDQPQSEASSEKDASSTEGVAPSEQQDEELNENEIPNGEYTDLSLPPADWDYFPEFNELSVKEPVLNLDPDTCTDLALDNSPPKLRPPSQGACDGYAGIIHIKHGDSGGASGTIFFQLMVGMLQWADQHNFKPYVHLNDFSKPVFDKVVHTQGPTINMTMMHGMEIGFTRDKTDPLGYKFPGRPELRPGTDELFQTEYFFEGTGIWEHYFEPVSDFSPGDPSCTNKPFILFDYPFIMPGTHSHAPYAPHAWRYWMPEYIQKPNIPLKEWFEPQRRHAAATTKRYIRFNAMMEQRAACAHPVTNNSLGMHIRHGDKWTSRGLVAVSNFRPYCEAFIDHGGGKIFLATDSGLVVDEIMREWPERVTSQIVRQPAVQGLSRNGSAAFDIGVSTHRTNVEALVDGLAMSKCTYLLHGLSALSEAAFFINLGLAERAVNLEDEPDQIPDVEYFVKHILPKGLPLTDTKTDVRNENEESQKQLAVE